MKMKIPYDRPECCKKYLAPCPQDCACFCRDMMKVVEELYRRHCRSFTKRQRILELARPKPKRIVTKVVPKCPCFLPRSIEIVRLEKPVHTRTDQLAFPLVWKLLLFKKRVRTYFPAKRMYVLNRLIRGSLFSLYSHLYNVQPPKEPVPKVKWTRKEWSQHGKKFEELALPKEDYPVPEIKKVSKPFGELKRYKKLSIPRYYEPEKSNEWKLTPAVKNYKISDRVREISVPKKFDEDLLFQELPIRPPESALTYKASAKIKELSEPHIKKNGGDNDLKENPFAISPNALKAKPSKRTKELAEPKEYENVHIRDNPQAISPAALKAKASPRTIQLAKPKGS